MYLCLTCNSVTVTSLLSAVTADRGYLALGVPPGGRLGAVEHEEEDALLVDLVVGLVGHPVRVADRRAGGVVTVPGNPVYDTERHSPRFCSKISLEFQVFLG